MVAVPAAMPVTIPEEDPIVAMAGRLLSQAPPREVLLNAIVAPAQTTGGPVMAAGNGLTVTVKAVLQPPE
jgi:hypothetical protein